MLADKMDLRLGGWYAPIENMRNGGKHNSRIIEDSIAATSICAEYCHWNMSFLLHLFSRSAVRAVEHSVLTFVDGTYCWTYAGGNIGVGWDVFHFTLWTSKDSKLAYRQDGRFKNSNDRNIAIEGGSYALPPIFVLQGEFLWQPHALFRCTKTKEKPFLNV